MNRHVHRLGLSPAGWTTILSAIVLLVSSVTSSGRPANGFLALALLVIALFTLLYFRGKVEGPSEIAVDDDGLEIEGERIAWDRLVGAREVSLEDSRVRLEFLAEDGRVLSVVSQSIIRELTGHTKLVLRIRASAGRLIHDGPFGDHARLREAGFTDGVPWTHEGRLETGWQTELSGILGAVVGTSIAALLSRGGASVPMSVLTMVGPLVGWGLYRNHRRSREGAVPE